MMKQELNKPQKDYLKQTGQLEEYRERRTKRIKRHMLLGLFLAPLIGLYLSFTCSGYDITKDFHRQKYSKGEIETIVEKDFSTPKKFITTPGRNLYYWVHDMK